MRNPLDGFVLILGQWRILDMAQFYGAAGLGEYDEVTGSSTVNSFGIDINTGVSITLVTAEWAYQTQGSTNQYGILRVRNSSNTNLNVAYRTWTSTTTSSFGSSNSSGLFLNYLALGADNNAGYTGEHFRAKMYIVNTKQTSLPFAHPTVFGEVSHEDYNGQIYNVCFSSKVIDTVGPISNLLFLPQAGYIRWYRANSYSLADT